MPAPEVPTCVSCGYPLSGLPVDPTRWVKCPECGTRQSGRMPPRPRPVSISQFMLWCCLPPVVLCSFCVLILAVAGECSALSAAAMAAVLTGLCTPAAYAWRLAITRPSTPHWAIILLMLLGMGINAFIGLCFTLWAAGYIDPMD